MAGRQEEHFAHYQSLGQNVHFLTVLINSTATNAPPTVEGARRWRDENQLINTFVVSDTVKGFSMVPGNQVGTPQTSVIDPRTKEVVALASGSSGGALAAPVENALNDVAARNALTRVQIPTVNQ